MTGNGKALTEQEETRSTCFSQESFVASECCAMSSPLKEPKVLEWGHVFRWQLQSFANLIMERLGNVFIRASNSKVVNSAQQEDFGTLKSGRVHRTIVCGALEAELR